MALPRPAAFARALPAVVLRRRAAQAIVAATWAIALVGGPVVARILTGLVLAPLLIYAVLVAPKAVMIAVLVLAAARAVDELLRMYKELRVGDRAFAALLATGVAAAPLLGAHSFVAIIGLVPVLWLAGCLWRPGDVETASRRAALGLLGISYIGVLIAMLVAILLHRPLAPLAQSPWGAVDTGRGALMATFLIVFAGDTGAYFSGRAFGGPKLYELISPKKTVSGAVGGLTASMLSGWLVGHWLLPLPLPSSLLLGAACGMTGQIGDLCESLFKRATGTKDSGSLLPGHGGLLDRVDGVLFAAPVVFAWLQWMQP